MQREKNIFGPGHRLSGLLMLLALAWLTISLPFVYERQQAQKQVVKSFQTENAAEEDANPLPGTTEEKTSNGLNLSEYLHDVHQMGCHSTLVVKFYKCHPDDLYFAFHPELISPPPEGFLS